MARRQSRVRPACGVTFILSPPALDYALSDRSTPGGTTRALFRKTPHDPIKDFALEELGAIVK
jgi:hypothetical protein